MRNSLISVMSVILSLFGCEPSNREVNDGISRVELLTSHNKERKSFGLDPLILDQKLEQRAQKHAEWMAKKNKLLHGNLDGTNFKIIGENIAMGYKDEKEVTRGWMKSPGHRQNILDKRFKYAGFGYACSKNGTPYWCAQFGGK